MTNRSVQTDLDDAGLESLFADARATTPEVSDALWARVMADADVHQPKPISRLAAAKPRGVWSRIGGFLGAALPVTGVLTAGLVGLYSGFALPFDFDFDLGLLASAQTLDFYPSDFETWSEVFEIAPPMQDE